jgi:hypothetical protein
VAVSFVRSRLCGCSSFTGSGSLVASFCVLHYEAGLAFENQCRPFPQPFLNLSPRILAQLNPRKRLIGWIAVRPAKAEPAVLSAEKAEPVTQETQPQLKQKHFTIRYDDTGYSFESMFGEYLIGGRGSLYSHATPSRQLRATL